MDVLTVPDLLFAFSVPDTHEVRLVSKASVTAGRFERLVSGRRWLAGEKSAPPALHDAEGRRLAIDWKRPAPYSLRTRSGRYRSAGRAVPT